jgi:lysyl-tRNA synthetase class 2
MADSGVQAAEASLANLILDEATGEKVSKSELKRRQKNRERDARKKEKEVTAPPKAEKRVSAEDEESNLAPNVSRVWRPVRLSLMN